MPVTKKQFVILLAITLVLKIGLAIYFSHLASCQFPALKAGTFALDGGDTHSYLDGIDNLLAGDDYFFWNGARKVYAGRMPFYGAPYFVLRLFFSPPAAKDGCVFLQIFIDALETVVLARLCFDANRRTSAFWLGWLFYFGSFSFLASSLVLVPESPSIGFFIFFLFFYQRFWMENKRRDALAASVALALLTVLKPYFVIIYPLFFIAVWFSRRNRTRNFSDSFWYFSKTAALGLPLVILLAPWIARNAVVLDKFIPAQENIWAGYNYSRSHLAFAEFVGAWGGGSIHWDAADAGCYFLIEGADNCNYSIPEYALTAGYQQNEIERVRNNFLDLQKNYSPELDDSTASEFERLTNIYRKEQPFHHYVGAKFIFLKKLFWHTNNQNLPIHSSFKCFGYYQLAFKVIQFGVYALALTFGSFGLARTTIRGKVSLLFILIALAIIVLFLELRTTEQRYVSQIFPILIIGLTAFLSGIWKNSLEPFNVRKIYRKFTGSNTES